MTEHKKYKKEYPDSNWARFFIDHQSELMLIMTETLDQYTIHFFIGGVVFWSYIIFLIAR